jgi:DNA-binding protein YbaB
MADSLSNVERMVDDWERDAAEKAAKFARMRQEVERVSITESAAGGAVRVTVGHNGLPTDVSMTDAVRKLSPDQIAAAVMDAMRLAQSRYPQRLAEIMAETVGDNATTRHILATADENFPRVEEEPAGHRPQRGPAGGVDSSDDDFGGGSIFRRD